jgi:hypothetical protein
MFILRSLYNNRFHIGSTSDITPHLAHHNASGTMSTKAFLPCIEGYIIRQINRGQGKRTPDKIVEKSCLHGKTLGLTL